MLDFQSEEILCHDKHPKQEKDYFTSYSDVSKFKQGKNIINYKEPPFYILACLPCSVADSLLEV